VTFSCPECGAVAREIVADAQQITYRGGCRHVEFEMVDGKLAATFPDVLAPKPRRNTSSAANKIALLETK
jgi:hypothetical protein